MILTLPNHIQLLSADVDEEIVLKASSIQGVDCNWRHTVNKFSKLWSLNVTGDGIIRPGMNIFLILYLAVSFIHPPPSIFIRLVFFWVIKMAILSPSDDDDGVYNKRHVPVLSWIEPFRVDRVILQDCGILSGAKALWTKTVAMATNDERETVPIFDKHYTN